MFFICENHKKRHKILSVSRRVRSIFYNGQTHFKHLKKMKYKMNIEGEAID